MTTVIKASGPADLLGLIPSLLGFTPTQSLVLIPFKDGRSMGAMRFDLPDPNDDDAIERCTSTAADYVTRVPEVTHALAVVYTGADHGGAITVLFAIQAQLLAHELGVADLLYVSALGWGSLLEGTGPNPMSEIPVKLDAPGFTGDQATGAELPVIDKRRAARISQRVLHADEHDPSLQLLVLMEKAATEPLTPVLLGALHWNLERPSLRDPLLIAWAQDQDAGTDALLAQMDWAEGHPYPQKIAAIMWGEGSRPDPARLRQSLENVRTLLAVAPSAGCYATAAWLAWALGQSTHAEVYADAGLELEPEHGLCGIVVTFVQNGHLPAWAFEKGAKA